MKAWNSFSELSPSVKRAALEAASFRDRRLFVALLQGTMTAEGMDIGPIDGILRQRTLRGYREFCARDLTEKCVVEARSTRPRGAR